MNRFFVEQLNDCMTLSGDNHTHIAYSLRLRINDEIVLFCGDGFDYLYKITSIKKNETTVELLAKHQNNSEAGIEIHSFVSLIKHDKMSLIYQKLSELGVREFFPIITEFSQATKKEFNLQRYSKICIEACKQCGRSIIPKVNEPCSFDKLNVLLNSYDIVIFAFEKANFSLKDYLVSKTKDNSKSIGKNSKIAVLIGAEGGFSKNEAETLIALGIKPVSLGKRILRAETAAIAAVSAVLYELDREV